MIAIAAAGGQQEAAPPPPAPELPPEEAAMLAAGHRFVSVISASSIDDAFASLESLLTVAKEHTERETKLAADRAAADNVERLRLVTQLITCGVEFPATAWERTAEGKPNISKPVARLTAEPLDALRDRVRIVREAKTASSVLKPPVVATDAGEKTFETRFGKAVLSAQELRFCSEYGTDPAKLAENKAIREAAIAARTKGVNSNV
jgi:hypothetical protein